MADQTCFRAAITGDPSSGGPILEGEIGKTTLLWDSTEPLGFSYEPFMVWVTAFDQNHIDFKFIDCVKKAPMNDSFTIALPDFDFAHTAVPSLLPDAADLAAKRQAGILFLNLADWARPPDGVMTKVTWDKLRTQALGSATEPPEQGKWPRAADLGSKFRRLEVRYLELFAEAARMLSLLESQPVEPKELARFRTILRSGMLVP